MDVFRIILIICSRLCTAGNQQSFDNFDNLETFEICVSNTIQWADDTVGFMGLRMATRLSMADI